MFHPTFDMTTEEHLGWDLMEFNDVLATLDAPLQAPVWTQLTQPTFDGGTPAGGGTPDAAGLSQAAMATPSPDQLGPQVVRHLTPGRTTGTRPGLALELLGRRGADTFRCSITFTMILYKLFRSTH
jgi:hypothetical protein